MGYICIFKKIYLLEIRLGIFVILNEYFKVATKIVVPTLSPCVRHEDTHGLGILITLFHRFTWEKIIYEFAVEVPAEMSAKQNVCLKINGEGKTPFLIGVAGGTASGKSTVCKKIMEKLGQADKDNAERQVIAISQDSFYRELTPTEKEKAAKGLFNFDHPDAFDEELLLQTLKDILAGKKCQIPVYDYIINSRVENQFTTIYPADVVLFEGILVFYFPEVRDLFHMKLFVDTDSDTRLARRVPRDIKERGRDLDQVLNQYMNFVKPAFEDFCMPTKKFADVIIPRGADNTVAIDLIVQHIRDFLNNRNNRTYESPTPLSPAPSPVHGFRRNNTFDGVCLSRPH